MHSTQCMWQPPPTRWWNSLPVQHEQCHNNNIIIINYTLARSLSMINLFTLFYAWCIWNIDNKHKFKELVAKWAIPSHFFLYSLTLRALYMQACMQLTEVMKQIPNMYYCYAMESWFVSTTDICKLYFCSVYLTLLSMSAGLRVTIYMSVYHQYHPFISDTKSTYSFIARQTIEMRQFTCLAFQVTLISFCVLLLCCRERELWSLNVHVKIIYELSCVISYLSIT